MVPLPFSNVLWKCELPQTMKEKIKGIHRKIIMSDSTKVLLQRRTGMSHFEPSKGEMALKGVHAVSR